MKVMTVPAYGTLQIDEVDAPSVGADELLVEVVAASVNAADGHLAHGRPFPVRFAFGLRRPKFVALGADVAGRVLAVGEQVTGFAIGDEVLADLSDGGFGAYAEQVAAPAKWWVKKPPSLSFAQAAALPMAGMTALRGLRDVGELKPGEQVLVVGASGGVGSFAVQIARALGAEVTAACSAAKADAVRGLGVTSILDVARLDDDLASGALADRFDVVFDCAAYRSPFAYRTALRPNGRYVLVGGAMSSMARAALLGGLVGRTSGKRYRSFMQTANAALLEDVVALAETGQVVPLIDRSFPLNEAAEGLRHLEERRVRGKVVIDVAGERNASFTHPGPSPRR